MKKAYSFLFVVFSLLLGTVCFAQEGEKMEMATGLRSSGKIYVVVVVAVTILLGFVFYLIHLDRKIGRVERDSETGSPR